VPTNISLSCAAAPISASLPAANMPQHLHVASPSSCTSLTCRHRAPSSICSFTPVVFLLNKDPELAFGVTAVTAAALLFYGFVHQTTSYVALRCCGVTLRHFCSNGAFHAVVARSCRVPVVVPLGFRVACVLILGACATANFCRGSRLSRSYVVALRDRGRLRSCRFLEPVFRGDSCFIS